MTLVDANVLLYAVNADADHHEDSRAWLDAALGGADTVGFAWIVVVAFVRLATHPSLFPAPLSGDEALDRVDAWLAQPPATIVEPGPGHVGVVRELLRSVGAGANLVNDAHLAAIALGHKASVVSYDGDFARFPGLVSASPTDLRSR
ncbi:MAG: PIN domain-containing protein [Acidimicrobiales bacterium]|nr:PIN domain-containing protein [Acidimicrobiales bacterium]